ncbi:MAG: AMP-binding protein [Eubacteriales bacterium]|nr:AMP-binding protein [Eubacteriales bacterium]
MEKDLYLDEWTAKKIAAEGSLFHRSELEAYQYEKVMETLAFAKENSRFYAEKLRGIDLNDILTLSDFSKIPFTTVQELSQEAVNMLCVSMGEIKRIVSLETSGSTGPAKRVYFTEEDQELSIDHFHHGMQLLSDASDTVLILLPCQRPGSVGDLLRIGVERLGAKAIPYGLVDNKEKVLNLMQEKAVTVIVGTPAQVLSLALADEENKSANQKLKGENIRSILLSTDYIPEETVLTLTSLWGCRVFEHYGMTEMGLGCAVSCCNLNGYHPREADLFLEIINPKTGEVLADGEFGEIVFTTLTRKAMPFIRYRTGDFSRFLAEPCPCGSHLKWLDKVGKRMIDKRYESSESAYEKE